MNRFVNLTFGAAAILLGGYVLWHLLPLMADPDRLRTVLIVLPEKYPGLVPAAKVAIFAGLLAFGLASVAWGVRSLRQRDRARLAHLNAVLLIQALFALALLEGGMRLAVAFDLGPFASASYLANPSCGDAYYRLVVDARAEAYSQRLGYDPELGWIRPPQPGNPRGLAWPPAMDARPKVWFFGDSFMAGVRAAAESVPAQVEALNPARQALNYGVGGYGLDQIWLRYRRVSEEIPSGSPVVVGVLTTDLDRSVLSYFGGFKPRFVPNAEGDAEGAGYRLLPPPPREELADRFKALAVDVPSYALAGLRAVDELLRTGFDRSEVACGRAEKVALNAWLIDAIVARAQARGHALRWVLFVPFSEFYKPESWRYDFLRRELEARGQRYVDTLRVLALAAAAAGRPPESYYIPVDGHLTADGSRVVAAAVADALPRDIGTEGRKP